MKRERENLQRKEKEKLQNKKKEQVYHILKMPSLVSSHDLLKKYSTFPWCLEKIMSTFVSHDEMA